MSLEPDYPEIERICKGVGVLNLEDAEDEAAMILTEVEALRAKVRILEAELDYRELGRLRNELERVKAERDVWMSAVADAVEPLGYDRHAASGPADLLPGLTTLTERACRP